MHQRHRGAGHATTGGSSGNGSGSGGAGNGGQTVPKSGSSSLAGRKVKLGSLNTKGKDGGTDTREGWERTSATSSFTTRRDKAGSGNGGAAGHGAKHKSTTATGGSNKHGASKHKPKTKDNNNANRGAISVKVKLGDAASSVWRHLHIQDLRKLVASSNKRAGNMVGSGVKAMDELRDKGWRREWRGIHLPPTVVSKPSVEREGRRNGRRTEGRRAKEELSAKELPQLGQAEAPNNGNEGTGVQSELDGNAPLQGLDRITVLPREGAFHSEALPPPSTLASGPSVPLYPLLGAILLYHLLKHLLFKKVFTYQTRTQLARTIRSRMTVGWRAAMFGGDGRQFTVSKEELAAQLDRLKRKREERLRRASASSGESCNGGGGDGDEDEGRGGNGGGGRHDKENNNGNGGNGRSGRGGGTSNRNKGSDDTPSRRGNPSTHGRTHRAHPARDANNLSAVSDQTSFLRWMERSEARERAGRRVEQLHSDLVCAKEHAAMVHEELSALASVKDDSPTKDGKAKRAWMQKTEEAERAERYVERLASDLCCAKERAEMLQERDEGGEEEERRESGILDESGEDGADAGERGGGNLRRNSDDTASRGKGELLINAAAAGPNVSGAKGIEQSSKELEHAKQRVEELSSELNCARERAATFQKQLSEARVEAEAQSKQTSFHKEAASQLERRLGWLAAENLHLSKENAVLNESVLKLQEENDELDVEMEHLVDEMEGGEHRGASVEFHESEELGSVLAESLTADPADAVLREAGEREALRASVDELRKELAEARADVARLTQERDGAADDARGLSLELARAKDEIATLRKCQEQLRERSFSHDLPPATAISFESQSSHHTIETYEAMRAERDYLRSQVKNTAQLTSQVRELMQERDDLAAKAEKAALDLAQVKNNASVESSSYDEDRAVFSQHIASHLEEVRNLEEELEGEMRRSKEQEATITELEETLEAQRVALQSTKEGLVVDLEALKPKDQIADTGSERDEERREPEVGGNETSLGLRNGRPDSPTEGSVVSAESMKSQDDLIVGFSPRIQKERQSASFDEVASSSLVKERSTFTPPCQGSSRVEAEVSKIEDQLMVANGAKISADLSSTKKRGVAKGNITPAKRSKTSGLRRLLSRSEKKKHNPS